MIGNDAYRFLKALDPDAENFNFLTERETDDTKVWKTDTHSGNLDGVGYQLENRNREGCFASVQVNESGSKSQQAKDIIRVRAIWHDDDNGWEGSFPLPPSLTIETSQRRYHRYWFVEGEWLADEKGRDDFSRIMQSMVSNFGSDPNAVDISRRLRLPGTYNWKRGEKHLAKIMWPEKDAKVDRYTREQLLAAFALAVEEAEAPSRTTGAIFPETSPEAVRSALSVIPSDDREIWLKVGMALHHEFGEQAYELWMEWSQRSTKFDADDQRRTWDGFSIDRANPITIASVFALAEEYHSASLDYAEPIPELTTELVKVGRSRDDLASRTMEALAEKFRSFNHNPHEDQMAGLEQVALVIQGMANATLFDNNFYVSFLAPGIGKTSTVIEAVRHMSEMEEYASTGVIIFLSRVDEIAKLVKEMNLATNEFSTVVSDSYPEVQRLGNQGRQSARVMFTTQQQLEARCKNTDSFEAIAGFHFNGKPRQVRIWDEAILPSKHLTANQIAIAGLADPLMQNREGELANRINAFSNLMFSSNTGDIVSVPDFQQLSPDLNELTSAFETDRHKDAWEAIWRLSDRRCRVRKDEFGNACLDYDDILPPDLGPMLILDASGEQRQTYRFWFEARKGLSFLKSPRKLYDGLTIHHWNKGVGNVAKKRDKDKLVEGVIKWIRSVPKAEQVLVVGKKWRRKDDLDWEGEIRSRINSEHVHFITWGQHTATNDFVDCKYVILADPFYYPTPQYEAIGRGAKGIKTDDEFSDDDFNETRLGEFAHNWFQAACRGAVRKSEGMQCPQGVHLFMIFSTRQKTGIPQSLLMRIFPNATVIDEVPVEKGLTKSEQGFVQAYKNLPKGVTQAQAAKQIGKSQQAISLYLKKPHVQEALAGVERFTKEKKPWLPPLTAA